MPLIDWRPKFNLIGNIDIVMAANSSNGGLLSMSCDEGTTENKTKQKSNLCARATLATFVALSNYMRIVKVGHCGRAIAITYQLNTLFE